MDYFRTPEIADHPADGPTDEEFKNKEIGGLGVHPRSLEYEDQQMEIKAYRLKRFLEDHDVRARVISDFEEKVSMLESRISDGKTELFLILKILSPNTHITKKLEEHGPLLGILPASFYAVITPLLIGIPKLAFSLPQEIHKIIKNKKELGELIAQGDTEIGLKNNEEEVDIPTSVGMIHQELAELGEMLVAHDIPERFDN